MILDLHPCMVDELTGVVTRDITGFYYLEFAANCFANFPDGHIHNMLTKHQRTKALLCHFSFESFKDRSIRSLCVLIHIFIVNVSSTTSLSRVVRTTGTSDPNLKALWMLEWRGVLNVLFNLFRFQSTHSKTGSSLGVAHFLNADSKNKWEIRTLGLFLWLWDFSII